MRSLSALLVAGVLAAQAATASPLQSSTEEESLERRMTGAASAGPYGLSNVRCQDVTLQVTAQSNNVQFVDVDDNYSNATYVSQQILDYTTAPANWTAEHQPSKDTTASTGKYRIRGHYCTPLANAKPNSSLIVGVHGVGFDSSYWNFAYRPSYSFVGQAASHGYSSFIYDRLGCGQSDAPSRGGYSILQAPTEVAVLQNILTQLRDTTVVGNTKHSKITLLGHSFGSVQAQAISATHPELIQGLVLTGFTTNSSNTASFFQAGTYTIANQVADVPQLKRRPDVWLATASAISDLLLFFDPPNYDQGAFQLARQSAQPVTLGSLFSIGAVGGVAMGYTGPLFVINGARDFPFCSRNCYAPSPTGGPIPDGVKALYPAAANFTSYIIPDTGHGISECLPSVDAARPSLRLLPFSSCAPHERTGLVTDHELHHQQRPVTAPPSPPFPRQHANEDLLAMPCIHCRCARPLMPGNERTRQCLDWRRR